MCEMPDLVDEHRAAVTARIRPAMGTWPEHEVVKDQPAPVLEQIEELGLAVRALEHVILVDPDHRLPPALRRQGIPRPRRRLLLGHQGFVRSLPFGLRYDRW